MRRPLLSRLLSRILSDLPKSSPPCHRREARRRFTPRRPSIEALEERTVPSTLSIADASAIEGGTAYQYTDAFVAPDAYGLAAARDLQVGSDGNVYVANHDTDVVKVFEGGTGRFLRDLSAPSGELDGPWAMTFGPDGGLYVSGRYSHDIVRFDLGSGASDVFVGTASGGLAIPWGIAFGPDGNLYASSHVEGSTTTTDPVKEYSGATGAYLGNFVAPGNGGLDSAAGIAFGPEGSLYVANRNSGDVKRYSGQTGAFLGDFVAPGSGGLVSPTRLLFHSDGYLYVSDQSSPSIFRYNATTGAFADVLAVNLSVPAFGGMAFAPSGELYLSQGTSTLQPGSLVGRMAPSSFAAFTVSLDAASTSPVSVSFATADGTALAGRDYGAWSGTLTFAPGETTRTILVATLNDNGTDPTRAFTVSLSSPVNATLGRSQGIGTILDDTQFYTVDGGSSDSTYQYASSGTALGSNALSSGDTAPRGIATTAAGTTEWVVDANKNVYVYSTGGTLLASWSAGGLPSGAQMTGIATNGTDLWLLAPGSSAKVFKYTGAASRLSGSQSAASSFSLNKSDSNPQDMVTDGISLWVVDGSALKVFKYTLSSGKLLGSWSIDSANTHPTGITIDPSNVSDIWIVDSGTLKVYDYTGAAGRTSGSQNAAAIFALNPYDTNPQGIADPPPADMLLAPVATSLPVAPPTVAVTPCPVGRDVLFAPPIWELLCRPEQISTEFQAAPPAPQGDSLTPSFSRGLTLGESAPSSDRIDVGLLGSAAVGADAAAIDSLFAVLADDLPPQD